MKIDNLDKDMINKILHQITIHYPFSFDHIRITFEFTQSFDATIHACELAISMGIASPTYIMELAKVK